MAGRLVPVKTFITHRCDEYVQSVGDLIAGYIWIDGAYEFASRIHKVKVRTVVHDIVIRTGSGRVPHVVGAVFVGGCSDLLRSASKADDARIEGFDVLPHHFRCIALWIDGDEQWPYLYSIRSEFLKDHGNRQ